MRHLTVIFKSLKRKECKKKIKINCEICNLLPFFLNQHEINPVKKKQKTLNKDEHFRFVSWFIKKKSEYVK